MIKVKVIYPIEVKVADGEVGPTSHQDFERRISAVTLCRSSPWPRSPTRASWRKRFLKLLQACGQIGILHVGWSTFLGSASCKPTWSRWPTVSNGFQQFAWVWSPQRTVISPSASARRSMSRASDIFILGFMIQDQEEEFDPRWGWEIKLPWVQGSVGFSATTQNKEDGEKLFTYCVDTTWSKSSHAEDSSQNSSSSMTWMSGCPPSQL